MVRDDQPDAREGQAGRRGDAERFVVPLKPGNAALSRRAPQWPECPEPPSGSARSRRPKPRPRGPDAAGLAAPSSARVAADHRIAST